MDDRASSPDAAGGPELSRAHNSATVISRRRGWTLGLDADRDRAADRYETIRRRLVQLFQWRGCQASEALADETIDRVSRRLAEGEVIQAGDPAAYFYGVARNVLKEYWTEQRRELTLQRSFAPLQDVSGGQDDLRDLEFEERLECLDRALARLSEENRRLITAYYRSEGGPRIAERAGLAESLGLSPGALRIRVHRIREVLEQRVNDCMRKKSDG